MVWLSFFGHEAVRTAKGGRKRAEPGGGQDCLVHAPANAGLTTAGGGPTIGGWDVPMRPGGGVGELARVFNRRLATSSRWGTVDPFGCFGSSQQQRRLSIEKRRESLALVKMSNVSAMEQRAET